MTNISNLILLHLLNKTTEEEEQQLTAWRRESEANEQLFQRLADSHYLEKEWQKRKMINATRAHDDMMMRISRALPMWRRPIFLRSAVAVVLILLCGGLIRYTLDSKDESLTAQTEVEKDAPIQVGSTHAFLTRADGSEIELNESMRHNQLVELACSNNTEATNSVHNESVRNIESLTLNTPRGGEFKVELEDGTEVWLNAQSRLIYPETFSDTERRVQVEGEAYFKVAHDASKPFYVETSGQLVRVIGTEFNVHSYPEDMTVQTTLVNGQIGMQHIDDNAREMILTPGHQAVFEKNSGSIKIKRVDTEVITSWKDGMFVFEDMTLSAIMQTLSRWYDFTYEFTDKKASETVFMGRIPRYSEFADVLKIIEMSGGLKLTLQNRKLTVSSI